MAISATHYILLKELHRRGELPQGGRILEIGEANVYGDFNPAEIPGSTTVEHGDDYGLAKLIYKNLFAPTLLEAVDLGGPTAMKRDLNNSAQWAPDIFQTVINHGTAEHIFNIANVFRLMHDACKPGGLLIHECPFTGWLDHGFYCLQPTLFYDVAAANEYQMVMVACEHLASKTYFEVGERMQFDEMKRRGQLADNLMLFVVMRKTKAGQFRIPLQGVYSQNGTDEMRQAWKESR